MYEPLRKTLTIGFAVLGLAFVSHGAKADPALPNLENLNFLNYTGAAPKNSFQAVNPVGWTGGSGLIYIDSPGTSKTSSVTACGTGPGIQTYGCPTTLNIAGGYNYVEADGNPSFESGFNYTVTGLTVGQTYTLSFYQAASQEVNFANGLNTTEQWIVSLGTSGMQFCNGCGAADPVYGGTDSTYSNPDPSASVVATSLMTTPSAGLVDWNFVTMSLTADATTDLLSFLAWGDDGNTVNLPPIVFLAGVNSSSGLNNVPEPGTIALFGLGLVGLGGMAFRRRSRNTSAA